MAFRDDILKGLLLLAAGLSPGSAALAAEAQPTVVELFTSQGCSSCPPANANLATISERPGILALSFGVTYWDYLGWKDTFAKREYTDRQITYEPRLGQAGPFTPQIVVNGRADTVGNRLPALEALVAGAKPLPGPPLHIESEAIAIGADEAPAGGADIWLVRYDPRAVEVPVGRGENSGHTLPHKNVVHVLSRLGTWTGAATAFPVTPASAGLRTAVLVQAPDGGPILAAAMN